MNLYVVIIVLFTLGGLALAAWSWKNIQKQKKTTHWSTTEAVVIESVAESEGNDRQPLVRFSYTVDGHEFQGIAEVPSDSQSDLPGFAERFIKQYPLHSQLNIYFNPENPTQSAVKVGVNSEDWFLFSVGASCFLLGLVFVFVVI